LIETDLGVTDDKIIDEPEATGVGENVDETLGDEEPPCPVPTLTRAPPEVVEGDSSTSGVCKEDPRVFNVGDTMLVKGETEDGVEPLDAEESDRVVSSSGTGVVSFGFTVVLDLGTHGRRVFFPGSRTEPPSGSRLEGGNRNGLIFVSSLQYSFEYCFSH